jgi:hypothetical protein
MTDTHIHNKTNTTYQIGHLFDDDGKSYDITVITNWPETFDFDDDDCSVKLIDFYFGDYDERTTDSYIDQFIKRQNQIKKSIEYLEKLKSIDPTDTEIDTTIKSLKSMVVKLF